uniref:Uncharacterized protein n=1 Tax=viral metagenome TaxID=1070528 RepID=A0A6C0DT18_9ZZZZ
MPRQMKKEKGQRKVGETLYTLNTFKLLSRLHYKI